MNTESSDMQEKCNDLNWGSRLELRHGWTMQTLGLAMMSTNIQIFEYDRLIDLMNK